MPVADALRSEAVPKSTVRKKKIYTPPAELRPQVAAATRKPSPTWVPATAVGLIIFAIVWLVTYYLTGQWWDLGQSFQFLAQLTWWNLIIGFSAMIAALAILSRWR
jgi:hypothetical protein